MDLEGLSLVCNGLGFDRDGVYHPHQFCSENMKDLQRFLRRDNPQTRDVFKQVCRFNTVAVDLVPIIEQHNDDRDLLITAVKVLVFMTMPIDPMSDDIAQQIEYLWNLKASLTRKDAVAAIASLLEEPLEHLDSDAFSEDDFNLVQLVFTLFRNLLAVQGLSPLQKASGTSTQFLCLAERFLEILFSEHVMELILVVTQHLSGSDGYLCQDSLLLLDIFHYIFLGQKPELVACSSREELTGNVNAVTSLSSLRSILEEEDEKRRVMRLQHPESLHFAGTFVRYNVDGSKTLLKGKPSVVPADSLLKNRKVHRGPLKRIMWENESLIPPNGRTLELLHGFAEQFLSGGYNVLMQSIRNDIQKEHHTVQNGDVMHFFQVARFFISYQFYRCSLSKVDAGAPEASSKDQSTNDGLFHGAVCGPIAETMNEAMFTLVLSKWHYAFDSLKETHDYKFLSSSGSLMKEMIRLLDLVLKLFSKEPTGEAYVARVLLHKIFYDQTEEGIIHFLFNLLKSFDSHKQPRSDLADLVEMVHIILRLMESFQSHGALRVSKKSRKRSKKRLGSVQAKQVKVGEDVQIDAAAESNCDAMHTALDPLDDEENARKGVGTKDRTCDYSQECGNESSENDEQAAIVEVDLDVTRIISMFANGTVVQNLCWLLRFYKSNHTNTNHYIISMLQRISDDLELSPMLFQLSILRIFFEILHDQRKASNKEYRKITSFITKLVGKLMNKLKSHPLLFIDILFWKTNRDCHYINSGFLLHEIGSLRSKARKWLDSSTGVQGGETDKIRPPINIADALGDDEADLLSSHKLDNIDEHEKSSLSGSEDENDEVGLLNIRTSSSAEGSGMDNDLSLSHSGKRVRAFNKEQEIMIRELFEQFKTQKRCSHLIANALDTNKKYSAAQVSHKLKQLGLHRPHSDIMEDNMESNEIDADFATTERKESDDETLSAYKERKKVKRAHHVVTNKRDAVNSMEGAVSSIDLEARSSMHGTELNAFVRGGQEGSSPNSSVPNMNSDESTCEHKNVDSFNGHRDYLMLKEIENGADIQVNRKKVGRLLHKSVDGTHQEMDFTQTDMANLEDDVEDAPRNVFRKMQKVVFDLEDE